MFVFALVLSAALIVIDQVIKLLVNSHIELNEVIEVIKLGSVKLFSLTHIRNSGAAWSIMQGQTWFLVALPIIVCGAGVFYMYKIRRGSKGEMISMAMIIAGGAGNLIDRVRMKEVIDYIKFEPINFPIFNFADICIVIGAIMFCIFMLLNDIKEDKKKQAAEAAENKALKALEEADLDGAELVELDENAENADETAEQPKKKLNKKVIIIIAAVVVVIIISVLLWLKSGKKK